MGADEVFPSLFGLAGDEEAFAELFVDVRVGLVGLGEFFR
ncbi:MAG: hypothetical protein QOJ59_514 [Thermomicrobiales bacterium]|jgi:hypothetical protein|nr:hypothetical protein [Thermomicrobiales bacterium]